MASAAQPDDNAAPLLERTAATLPASRRQSAEAIGLLLAVLVVLLGLALTVGAPPGVGS